MSYKGLFSAIECNRIVIIEDDFKQGEYKKERALYLSLIHILCKWFLRRRQLKY